MRAAGDREAFNALPAIHLDRLYATATLVLHDRALAEDAVQEALIRAWRDLPALRDPTRVAAWLRRLLIRACYDEARRQRRSVLVRPRCTRSTSPRIRRPRCSNATSWTAPFDGSRVEHRTSIVLRHFLDLTVPDIADAMRVPLGTAKSRLHHAERALRAALEADEQTGCRRPRECLMNDQFNDTLSDWLASRAPASAPDRILDAVAARVDDLDQRPDGPMASVGGGRGRSSCLSD